MSLKSYCDNVQRYCKPKFCINMQRTLLITVFILISFRPGLGQETTAEPDPFEIVVHAEATNLTFSLNDTTEYQLIQVECQVNAKDVAKRSPIQCVESDVEKGAFLCNNLDPCLEYTAILEIKNLTATEESTFKRQNNSSTKHAVPRIFNVQTESETDNITLNWEAEFATCILQYQLKYFSYTEVVTLTKTAQANATDMTIDQLNACSRYQLDLHIIDIQNAETEGFSNSEETKYKKPIVVLNEPIANTETIELSWTAEHSTCIQKYSVVVIGEDNNNGVFNWSGIPTDNALIVDERSPCVLYNIDFKVVDINGDYSSNETKSVETEYAEPGNVTLNITVNVDKITVSWNDPQYKSCVQYYHIKWFEADCQSFENADTIARFEELTTEAVTETTLSTETTALPEDDRKCSWFDNITDKNVKEIVITDLAGCEDYKVNFYINNLDQPKSEEQDFTTLNQVPSSVSDLEIITNSTNVTLTWKIPKLNTKCVVSYKLTLDGPLQRELSQQLTIENITTETTFFYDNLEPCGHYNLTIEAISLNGSIGEQLSIDFDMNVDKPSIVQNGNIVAEERALEVSWEPPLFAELCIDGYRITMWDGVDYNQYRNVDKDTNSIKFEQLSACHIYNVQIIAYTRPSEQNENVQMDGYPLTLDKETAMEEPHEATNLQMTATYPHGLELNAQDLTNTCFTIFARFRCNVATDNDVVYKFAEQYVESGTITGTSFKALLTPLSPFTGYNCDVALYNGRGWSNAKLILNQQTLQYYPDCPERLEVANSTNESLELKWKPPKYANGVISIYQYHFQIMEAAYSIPERCAQLSMEVRSSVTANTQERFLRLSPFTKYSLQVAAKNDYGVSEFSAPLIARTKPWISEPIVDLKTVTELHEIVDTYAATVVISWLPPCRSNGNIEAYILTFTGERMNYTSEYFKRTFLPNNSMISDNGLITYNETYLRPEYNYMVNVAVKTADVEQTSQEVSQKFNAPAGIPCKLNEQGIRMTRVDAYMASNPTKSAVVEFPANILQTETGNVKYMAFLLSEKGCNEEPTLTFGVLDANNDWPNIKSWKDVYDGKSECIQQYQTNDIRWDPMLANQKISRNSENIMQYIIGIENCNDAVKEYCNGPLKPDTEYYLVMRLFTISGYNDVVNMQFKTDSLIKLKLIIIIVCSCMLLALAVGLIYLWINKRIKWQREFDNGIEDSFGDMHAKNFAIFYSDVSKREKLAREFKDLSAVAVDLSYVASELSSHKNRYADIYPYDKNRVILDVDLDGTDYINASFIDGYKRKKEYIATQGPKAESVMDFWRMVLQHNVRVIVMVTQFREGDVIKCHEYYPYKEKGINVSIKKKDTFELYDRTEMSVSHDVYGLKQKVVHFYFKKWPDHGCPQDPNSLITFVRKVKAEKVPRFSPIVVHCSAGVGRTGTFIGLDIIMQRLRTESKLNIFETVKKLRFQRMKMVQTLMQYTFLYSCSYELVKHKATRAALKARKQNGSNGKQVSFQDEAEITAEQQTQPMQQLQPYKMNGRCNLEALPEYDETSANGKQFDLNAAMQRWKSDLNLRNESPL